MIRQYVVDAFTNKPFSGNPAAVCVMESYPDASLMMSIASEMRLSETAFIVRNDTTWQLRWFTPTVEVELCGHATLASAYVVMNHEEPGSTQVAFDTISGPITVRRDGTWYRMHFAGIDLKEVEVTDEMERAFAVRPQRALLGLDLICVFDSDTAVINAEPTDENLLALPGRMAHITAAGTGDIDCVSRCFGPKIGIHEDPVCGSAHVQIARLWAETLGKTDLYAFEASSRGGYLKCRVLPDDSVEISGQAALFATSRLHV